MSGLETVLDTRASFELAALVVTWAAVVALALVAAHLHVRLRRLEEGAAAAPGRPEAFGRLVGERTEGLAGDGERLVLFVSSDGRSCDAVLRSLHENPPAIPLAVAWTDGPADASMLPQAARLLEAGSALADELGIRVTPFALVVAADGTVLRAGPAGSTAALHRMTERTHRDGITLATAPSH